MWHQTRQKPPFLGLCTDEEAAAALPPGPPLLPCGSPAAAAAAGARHYTQRYLHLGAWLLVVLAGYLIGRGTCQAGLPGDCLREVRAGALPELPPLFMRRGAGF